MRSFHFLENWVGETSSGDSEFRDNFQEYFPANSTDYSKESSGSSTIGTGLLVCLMLLAFVAGGIKVALLTTVFGLIVAIILQVFYNYIVAKIDSIVNDMEDASINLIDILVAYKK